MHSKILTLTTAQRTELKRLRDRGKKPYVRERASALLKIADGQSPHHVSQTGLSHPRDPHTVYAWLARYNQQGVAGLFIKSGRGRKAAFFPRTPAVAHDEVERVLAASPRQFDQDHTRWRLADIGYAVEWLRGKSIPGIRRTLRRLGFSRKQAQNFIRSPDPLYDSKWRAILQAFSQAVADAKHTVLLFLDEATYYRRPSKAPAYHEQGHSQPRALETPRANTQTRLVATLDSLTAQVLYLQRSKVGIKALVDFYAQVRSAYPEATTIYIVQDNWPTHSSDEVLEAMRLHHLTPLFLPTYASWLNPIEKLWRWLRQDVLHLHRCATSLETLRQQVRDFLDQFMRGSDALLKYVGLFVD